jgi:hypothetical protein
MPTSHYFIKFAGICGKTVEIVGQNRATLGESTGKPS